MSMQLTMTSAAPAAAFPNSDDAPSAVQGSKASESATDERPDDSRDDVAAHDFTVMLASMLASQSPSQPMLAAPLTVLPEPAQASSAAATTQTLASASSGAVSAHRSESVPFPAAGPLAEDRSVDATIDPVNAMKAPVSGEGTAGLSTFDASPRQPADGPVGHDVAMVAPAARDASPNAGVPVTATTSPTTATPTPSPPASVSTGGRPPMALHAFDRPTTLRSDTASLADHVAGATSSGDPRPDAAAFDAAIATSGGLAAREVASPAILRATTNTTSPSDPAAVTTTEQVKTTEAVKTTETVTTTEGMTTAVSTDGATTAVSTDSADPSPTPTTDRVGFDVATFETDQVYGGHDRSGGDSPAAGSTVSSRAGSPVRTDQPTPAAPLPWPVDRLTAAATPKAVTPPLGDNGLRDDDDSTDAAGGTANADETDAATESGEALSAPALPRPATAAASASPDLASAVRVAGPTPSLSSSTHASVSADRPDPTGVSGVRPVEVAGHVVRVAQRSLGVDGTQHMRLEMHPGDLGAVAVELTIEGATVHVDMTAERGETNELLRASLGELRTSLIDAGFAAGRLDIQTDLTGNRFSHGDGRGNAPDRSSTSSGDRGDQPGAFANSFDQSDTREQQRSPHEGIVDRGRVAVPIGADAATTRGWRPLRFSATQADRRTDRIDVQL